jgi:hypothetical protein
MNYSDLTWRHFQSAAAAGVLAGPTVRRGAAGSRAQGTWVQFDVIAVSDWVSQAAVGRDAKPVLPETVQALCERFDVPIEKLGRLLIIEDAWIAALSSPYEG